jgi:hypothetical protein
LFAKKALHSQTRELLQKLLNTRLKYESLDIQKLHKAPLKFKKREKSEVDYGSSQHSLYKELADQKSHEILPQWFAAVGKFLAGSHSFL